MRAGIMIPLAAALLTLAVPARADRPAPLRPAADDGTAPYEVWQLDQLRIARDTDEAVLKALEPVHSLEAAIATLEAKGVRYRRTRAVLLPDRLPEKVRTDILALPSGEPFVLPEGGFISISVLVGRKLPPGAVRWTPGATRAPERSA